MDLWNIVGWVGIVTTAVGLGWIFWSARSGTDLGGIFSDPGGYPGDGE